MASPGNRGDATSIAGRRDLRVDHVRQRVREQPKRARQRLPRHNPALHRSPNPPMSPRRRRLLIIGAIVVVAALGWGLATILKPAFRHTIVITTGRITASIAALQIAMRPS